VSAEHLPVLLPFLVAAGGALGIMLLTAFQASHRLVHASTAACLAAALATLAVAVPSAPRQVTSLLIIDRYGLFYLGLVLAAALIVVLLSYRYMEAAERGHGEYYLLLVLGTVGAGVLVCSSHFASLFLGLEILTVSLYGLVAYRRRDSLGAEAGIKYLVLAGVSSAFLLFGLALMYAELGTMQFAFVAQGSPFAPQLGGLALAGLGMVLAGLGFKLALVPFHLWAPDVYQGAPAPVTAYIASVSKAAVLAFALRFLTVVGIHRYPSVVLALTLISLLSMFAGNLLALLQNSLKRLLAYSSISHLGYLLVGIVARGSLAATAVSFYLVAYVVSSLGAFGVVTVLSSAAPDADSFEEYRGLVRLHPWLAGSLILMLFSLAGIPLTGGFLGKFYVLAAGLNAGLRLLVIALVVTSLIGLFTYLRLVVAAFLPAGEGQGVRILASGTGRASVRADLPAGVALCALTLLVVAMGVYPSPLIRLIEAAVSGAF
jgi:NADH-quinone oxidoreductase subunit N